MPVVLNAANEEAVDAYLDARLSFRAIPQVIERTMAAHRLQSGLSIDVVREVDRWAREFSRGLIAGVESKV
jgi:1-deoxy-D-xylulose-5-phosphate reductoisomerase